MLVLLSEFLHYRCPLSMTRVRRHWKIEILQCKYVTELLIIIFDCIVYSVNQWQYITQSSKFMSYTSTAVVLLVNCARAILNCFQPFESSLEVVSCLY